MYRNVNPLTIVIPKFSLQDSWATPVSVSGLQKLPHSAVYDPASVYQLSTAAPSAARVHLYVRLYVRVRRLKPIQAPAHTRTHARTHTRVRTHTHHRSLASRSAPRLEPRSWCVCVLCDRNVVLFLDKPLSGALERPRGRKWGTCDPHLPQQGCFSQASPLGVALKAEKVPYLVPYVL